MGSLRNALTNSAAPGTIPAVQSFYDS